MQSFNGCWSDKAAILESMSSLSTVPRRCEVLGVDLFKSIEEIELTKSTLDDYTCQRYRLCNSSRSLLS